MHTEERRRGRPRLTDAERCGRTIVSGPVTAELAAWLDGLAAERLWSRAKLLTHLLAEAKRHGWRP